MHRRLEEPAKIESVRRSTKHEAEIRWLGDNEKFLEENYAGKWVAVKGSALVAVGDAFDEAARAAEACGVKDPVIAPVRPKELQGGFLIR